MKFKIDYYITRKSDNKLMHLHHIEVDEDFLLEAVKKEFTAPINLSVGDDDDCEYYYSDASISEVTGLN